MSAVDSRYLRDHIQQILDGLEAGESIIITVDGLPTAELRPLNTRPRFLDRAAFVSRCLPHRADAALTADLAELAPETTDDLAV
jgi:antitoxin (DNA-binding transcriptional repressor) of toxin-antitoxin stability system